MSNKFALLQTLTSRLLYKSIQSLHLTGTNLLAEDFVWTCTRSETQNEVFDASQNLILLSTFSHHRSYMVNLLVNRFERFF